MVRIDTEELKQIQLEILVEIHSFCVENNIGYSLACGTLLGAIRHKGYIPWDDDIDIYLLRDDYNKLMSSFPSVLNNVKIASLGRDGKWGRPYAKAYDSRTGIIDGSDKYQVGIGIDVYPIDSVPQRQRDWKKYNRKRVLFQHIYECKVYPFRKGRATYLNILLLLAKLSLALINTRTLGSFLDKYSQKNNNTDSDYIYECCQGANQNDRFLRSDMNDFIDALFENHSFKIMAGYDDYLHRSYGDYMQLPPEEKRKSHHEFIAWWK